MDDLPPTEAQNPSTADLDTLDTLALLHRINDEDRRAAASVERELGSLAAAVDAIVARLRRGGSLHYFGAGTSGRLGLLDAAEMPPTFSTDPKTVVGHIAGGAAALTRAVEDAEDDADAGRAEVIAAGVGPDDVVVGISASGAAAYVVAALEEGARADALTVCITNSPGSPVVDRAKIPVVLLTGPEAIAGSTRMKAAAAQKMALTALSTAVMVRLGKVHGNLMVDVAPSNTKLRARALRLTQQIAGVGEDDSREALRRSGYRVKVAVLVAAHGCDVAAAESMLEASAGSLRAALRDKNHDAPR
jgi:N-acetylmuramic acid 6-phosphate etherase